MPVDSICTRPAQRPGNDHQQTKADHRIQLRGWKLTLLVTEFVRRALLRPRFDLFTTPAAPILRNAKLIQHCRKAVLPGSGNVIIPGRAIARNTAPRAADCAPTTDIEPGIPIGQGAVDARHSAKPAGGIAAHCLDTPEPGRENTDDRYVGKPDETSHLLTAPPPPAPRATRPENQARGCRMPGKGIIAAAIAVTLGLGGTTVLFGVLLTTMFGLVAIPVLAGVITVVLLAALVSGVLTRTVPRR